MRYSTVIVGIVSCVLAALGQTPGAQAQQPPPTAAPASAQRPSGQPAPAASRRPDGRVEAPSTESPAAAGSTERRFPAPPAVERLSKTEHSITVNGRKIAYTATAGTLVLRHEDERPLASIFFVAYTRDDQPDHSKWPVTFAFNGGPGSSSVWLHMGALGPRRVVMGNAEGIQPAPPYRLTDNEDTTLDMSDLVFIDPVTTGFSRHAPGENPAQFHSVEGDLSSVADFIQLYLTRFDRWASPKFLAGESYGTTRAAGLSDLLNERGIALNGITLLSSVLNFQTLNFAVGNDLPYAMFLPSYTATAWYHKKLPPDLQGGDLQKAIAESRRFASNEYTLALMKGSALTGQDRANAVRRLARLTGLSERFVEQSNLRISMSRFAKELLRDQRRTIGRYDSRLEGMDLDAAGERAEYDPSYAAVQSAYTAMFNSYVKTELNYSTDLQYAILTGQVRPWSYGRAENRYLNVAEPMRQAITQNPALHVLVGAGYYDLATPFFAAEYTVDHLDLDPSLRKNVSLYHCDAGHMLYMKKACLDSFHQAMATLYKTALGQ